MPITLEQEDARSVIALEGPVEIATAAELKQMLLDSIGAERDVQVSVAGVTDLDITAVQLLWAAIHEAKRAGAGFAIAGPLPEQVARALSDAGFEELPVLG